MSANKMNRMMLVAARRTWTLAIIAVALILALASRHTTAQVETLRADAPMILVPMDFEQTDHLRAYGLAYWCLEAARGYKVQWLLNYRGGSFLAPDAREIRDRATVMGVSYRVLDPGEVNRIYHEMTQTNSEAVILDKAPKVAVYVPPTADPWDDAVRLVLGYAQIPYDTVWDPEVIAGKLSDYDWLHLHHEDFTGQYGKFYGSFKNADWYLRIVKSAETMAAQLGFSSAQELKGEVAAAIKDYVRKGGFLFAMCSAPDSLDVALSARGLDIAPMEIGGVPMTPGAQDKLDYSAALAFTDFRIVTDPLAYEISDIDAITDVPGLNHPRSDFLNPLLAPEFELFEFSAKQDPALSIFVQNHAARIRFFHGQTTDFRRDRLKDNVVVLADTPGTDRVRYIHGSLEKGSFTFLGGHDPEDFSHLVGDPQTDVSIHANSPGYRLILNNVLFPSMQKKEKKT